MADYAKRDEDEQQLCSIQETFEEYITRLLGSVKVPKVPNRETYVKAMQSRLGIGQNLNLSFLDYRVKTQDS